MYFIKVLFIYFWYLFFDYTRIAFIRILFVIASIYKLVVDQIDVKTTFLNGDLEEEIYMEQPEGYVVLGQEHKVCKLVKSLSSL